MCLMTILLLFAGWLTASGQEKHITTGIELSGLAFSRIGIDLEYAVSSHWSANGFISFKQSWFNRKKSSTELEHTGSFSQSEPAVLTDRADSHCEHIAANYWPLQVSRGFFISTGLQQRNSQGIDGLIGIGYCMNIWSCISIKASYFTPILNITEWSIVSDGLRLHLCYTF